MCSNFAVNGEREPIGAEDGLPEKKEEGDYRPTREGLMSLLSPYNPLQ